MFNFIIIYYNMRFFAIAMLAMAVAATTLQQDEPTPILAEAEESVDRRRGLNLCKADAQETADAMDMTGNDKVT